MGRKGAIKPLSSSPVFPKVVSAFIQVYHSRGKPEAVPSWNFPKEGCSGLAIKIARGGEHTSRGRMLQHRYTPQSSGAKDGGGP